MGIERRTRKGGKASYVIDWRDHTGKRLHATFRTESDAKAALRLRVAEAAQIVAGLKAPPVEAHTFDDLAAYWLAHKAAKKRHGGRDDAGLIALHLAPVLAGVDVRAIGREQIDAVTTRLEAARFRRGGPNHGKPDPDGVPYKPRMLQRALTMLGSLLRLAEDLRWIDRAPRIYKPKVATHDAKKAWLRTDVQIARFLRAAAQLDADDDAARARGAKVKGPRAVLTHARGVHPLYAAGVYTGMRLGELAALRWTDVDMERGRILVSRSHDRDATKGGYSRTVPIADDLAPILRAWKLRSPGLHVFPTTAGTQRAEDDRVFRETFKAVLARAEIPRVDEDGRALSFHSLRHTWASHMVLRGVDLFALMKVGGWKSYAMVSVYAHLLPDAFDGMKGMMRLPALPADGATVTPLPAPATRATPTKRAR